MSRIFASPVRLQASEARVRWHCHFGVARDPHGGHVVDFHGSIEPSRAAINRSGNQPPGFDLNPMNAPFPVPRHERQLQRAFELNLASVGECRARPSGLELSRQAPGLEDERIAAAISGKRSSFPEQRVTSITVFSHLIRGGEVIEGA
jgi:hypothetical protein